MGALDGRRVAILATDGVEQVELEEPRRALEDEGADISLLTLAGDEIQGFNHLDRGDSFKADGIVADAAAGDFDALMLPGGVANPDALRADDDAVSFVREFFDDGKPVAAICHAPWTLVEADVVRGRRLTSFHSVKTDLVNAGADWVDEEVVVDQGLVTSRNPDDIPAFNAKMIEEFAEGEHDGQHA